MDKKTDPQRGQTAGQSHSAREWLVQKSKLGSQTLEPTSLNILLLASWPQMTDTELCRPDLPSRKDLLLSFGCMVSWQPDICSCRVYTCGNPSQGHASHRAAYKSDQARHRYTALPFGPNTGRSEGQYTCQPLHWGWSRLHMPASQFLFCLCSILLPHSSLTLPNKHLEP